MEMYVTEDMAQRQALMNMAMNLRVLKEGGEFIEHLSNY
jgi:hypothetical protein